MRRVALISLIVAIVLTACTRSSWKSPANNPSTNGCETPDGTLIQSSAYRNVKTSRWQWNGCHTGVLIHLTIHEQPKESSELIFFLDVANPAEGGSPWQDGAYQRLNDQNFLRINERSNLGNYPHFMLMYYPEAQDVTKKGHLLVQPVAVPRRWRVRIVMTNDVDWKFSVGYSMLK